MKRIAWVWCMLTVAAALWLGVGFGGSEARASTQPTSMTVPVLDFCGLKPVEDETRFVKGRVVLFQVGSTELLEAGESSPDGKEKWFIMKKINASRFFQMAVNSYLPMRRFHTILAGSDVPADWFEAESLEMAQMAQASGSGQRGKFVAYSLACADYVAFSRITDFTGKWSQVKGKINGQEVLLWNLDTTVKGEFVIFHREGSRYVRHAKFKVSSGGLLGFASKLGTALRSSVSKSSKAISIGEKTEGLATGLAEAANPMDFISVIPDSNCNIPSQGVDGTSQIPRCHGNTADLPDPPGIAGMGEANKPYCADLNQTAPSIPEEVARCESAKAAELYALSAGKRARSVDGWRLFGPLQDGTTQDDPGTVHPAISLGENEGVNRGMGFHAVVTGDDGKKKKVAYAKVTKVGPGGDDGLRDPSLMDWRYGTAEEGTRMEEHPLIGLSLGLEPSVFIPLLGDKSPVELEGGNSSEFPAAMVGVGLGVGYDLTPYLRILDEFWLQVSFSFNAAPTSDYLMTVIHIQVGPEVRKFLFSRLFWFGFLGGNVTAASLNAWSTSEAKTVTGSGSTGGLAVKTGLDFMFNADWYARFTLGWVQNFGGVEYKKDDRKVFEREDGFSGLSLLFSLNYNI